MINKKIYGIVIALCCLISGCNRDGQIENELLFEQESETSQYETSEMVSTSDTVDNVSIDTTISTDTTTFTDKATSTDKTIVVYVCGAVNQPGIVELPYGSRGAAAIEAAGGFREDAEEGYVNLAARLNDEEMLTIPTKEEAKVLVEIQENKLNGKVNLNTASVEELCTLPGIGESRAEDIIRYRTENGAFTSPEDIMQIPGVKTSTFEKIKDKIIVN